VRFSAHFYDVGGLLVRRWVPAQRRTAMEVWNGDGWAPYPNVDSVLRHGRRLTDVQALALLHEARRGSLRRFSDDEAHLALRDRLRRG
jgi:hypothetical protein